MYARQALAQPPVGPKKARVLVDIFRGGNIEVLILVDLLVEVYRCIVGGLVI